MSKSKELAKNTVILFIGTFFTKVVQYFLLPVYTGYLTTEEYGTVDLFTTIISLLIPIIGLQIEQGVFRYLISKRDDSKSQRELISSSFAFLLLSSLISLIIILIILPFIKNDYKWLVVLNLYFTYFSTYFMQISRGLGNNKVYSISGFITSVITILFNILFLVGIGLKIDGMLYGSAIGYFIGIIYLLFRLKIIKYLSIKSINKESLKLMLSYSLPMIPNSLSWWVFSSSDRFIITAFVGLSATGLLSVAYKFSNIGIIIYNVFNLSITESISLHIKDNDIEDYYNNIFKKMGVAFTSFGAIIIAFMPMAFNMLINKSYGEGYGLIPIAIIATVFQVLSGNLGIIYVAKSNTKSIAITSILAATVNIVTDLALVKFIGVYAAVISTVISYLVLFIYRYIDVNKKYMKVRLGKTLIINMLITSFVVCGLYYINNIYIMALNMLIALLTSIIFNKESIIFVFKKIQNKVFKNNKILRKYIKSDLYKYIINILMVLSLGLMVFFIIYTKMAPINYIIFISLLLLLFIILYSLLIFSSDNKKMSIMINILEIIIIILSIFVSIKIATNKNEAINKDNNLSKYQLSIKNNSIEI